MPLRVSRPDRGPYWAHALHLERFDLLRSGERPGQGLQRHRGPRSEVPSGACQGQRPDPLQAGLRGVRRGGGLQRHRAGVRGRRRPQRGHHRRGHRHPARGTQPRDRGGRVRPGRRHRPDHVRQELLPRARGKVDQIVCAACQDARRDRPRRDRPLRAAEQDAAGGAAGEGFQQARRHGDHHPAVARRDPRSRFPGARHQGRDQTRRAEDGRPGGRIDERGFPPGQLPRRLSGSAQGTGGGQARGRRGVHRRGETHRPR